MNKLKKIFSETLEIPESKVENLDLESDEIDSFKKLLLISNVEKEFEIVIDMEDAFCLSSFQDYFNLLILKGVKKDEI